MTATERSEESLAQLAITDFVSAISDFRSPARNRKADKYLELYCQRMKIDRVPRLITTMKEYRHFVKEELAREKMPRIKHNLGRCFTNHNTIWVNVKRHHSARTLRHTIAHELVHLKHPSLPHGKRFDELTMKVISGRY